MTRGCLAVGIVCLILLVLEQAGANGRLLITGSSTVAPVVQEIATSFE